MLVYILLFVSILLWGCSKEIDPSLQGALSKNHQIIVKKLLNKATKCNRGRDGKYNCTSWLGKRKQSLKGSSWDGKWIATTTKNSLVINEGAQFIPLELTARKTLVPKDKFTSASIEAIKIDFLNLKPSYFSIATTDKQTRLITIRDFKDDNNVLSWTAFVESDPSYMMKSQAVYNPKTDSIKGKTEILLSVKVSDDNDNIKENFFSAASYKWEASRIPDKVFDEYARVGIIQPNVPHGKFDVNLNSNKLIDQIT